MNPSREPLSRYLDPRTIEVYLMAHQWEAKTRNEMFSIWHRSDAPNASDFLFVPLSEGPADYEERLKDVVKGLAATEGRDLETVLTNLRYATADLVRIALVSPRVGPGELPIEDGRKLFDAARDLMWSAACAAVQPRASFGPKAPASAKDYLDGVRLGQTERGSYVVTVISEVDSPEQQALLPDDAAHLDIPFGRKVTTGLMHSLGATRAAAERVLTEQSTVGDSFEDVIEQGVSANLCAAIARMGEEQAAAEVRVHMNWAASRPPTIEAEPVGIRFAPSTLPVLSEAVEVLRQLGPFDDEVVEGFVIRLNRGRDEAAIGSIVIEGSAHGAKRNVHVELPDDQYHLAIKAHDERHPVRIRGTLAKRGRNWVLSDPGQLRLEEPDGAPPASS